MTDAGTHISGLHAKLQLLIRQHEALLTLCAQQKKTITASREKEKQQSEELEMLRQQQLILKASLNTLDSKDKKELEQKINGYIRNIDKCISLLSHEEKL